MLSGICLPQFLQYMTVSLRNLSAGNARRRAGIFPLSHLRLKDNGFRFALNSENGRQRRAATRCMRMVRTAGLTSSNTAYNGA